MKNNISYDQLIELNNSALMSIDDKWTPKRGDSVFIKRMKCEGLIVQCINNNLILVNHKSGFINVTKNDIMPLFCITQLIEIVLGYYKKQTLNTCDISLGLDGNMCDSLWYMIKNIVYGKDNNEKSILH